MDTIWKPTVLVIGDDETFVNLVFEWLVDEYRVRTATTNEYALERIDASADAILFLKGLPGVTSGTVTDQIIQLEPEPAVIFITGKESGELSLDLSFEEHIQKPIREQELKEQVARVVRQRAYDGLIREFYSIASKRALVKQDARQEEGMATETDTTLRAQQSLVEEQLDAVVKQFDARDYRCSFQMLDTGGQP